MCTLVYLGYRPDSGIPWGGYHITITGRNPVPFDDMLRIARRSCRVLPEYIEKDSSAGERYTLDINNNDNTTIKSPVMVRGLVLEREHIVRIERQSAGLFMVFLKSSALDDFANELRTHGTGHALSNIKWDWHISMHCDDADLVQQKVELWLRERVVWRVYVNHWDESTHQGTWYCVDE